MRDRYDEMTAEELRLITQGMGCREAERSWIRRGTFLRPDDRMGRVVVSLYRNGDAWGTADALVAYARAYNACAPTYKADQISKDRLIRTTEMTLDEMLTEGEIAEVLTQLCRQLDEEEIAPGAGVPELAESHRER